jgi:hypothetical protein
MRATSEEILDNGSPFLLQTPTGASIHCQKLGEEDCDSRCDERGAGFGVSLIILWPGLVNMLPKFHRNNFHATCIQICRMTSVSHYETVTAEQGGRHKCLDTADVPRNLCLHTLTCLPPTERIVLPPLESGRHRPMFQRKPSRRRSRQSSTLYLLFRSPKRTT